MTERFTPGRALRTTLALSELSDLGRSFETSERLLPNVGINRSTDFTTS